jgi:hypothetical protein
MSKKSIEITIIPEEVLINKIYFLKNEKVMLDKDLALLYGVKSIRLREQVKRNISKFPSHFMFQLTDLEVENNGIAKCDTIKKTPRRDRSMRTRFENY